MDRALGVWRDLSLACRALARSRAFTFVCVISLGIGMAPVIAIQYGSRILTTPPPSVNTEGLVELVTTRVRERGADDKWSFPDFVDLRDARPGASLVGWAVTEAGVIPPDAGGRKTTCQAMFVSTGYFGTLGVTLSRGPGFPPTDEPTVILAHAFWQRRFASDPDIVGRLLPVNGVPHVITGVAPEQFAGHLPFQAAEIFLPLGRYPALLADSNARFDRSTPWVHIHGRLSPGVSVEQASAAVSALTTQLARAYPATNESVAGLAAPYLAMGNREGADLSIIMAVWHAMTAIPLIVVCLNISGMVQVRAAMRERDLTIRQAVGATRGRLMQHMLAEAIVLAFAGGSLAALVLFSVPPIASWWMGEPMPAQLQQALRVDGSMLALCAGLCLATSLLFGWLPAARFSRPAIMTVLKDEAGSSGIRAGRMHRVTSALQVAIAVPLLVLSAISLDRVRATATTNLGFAADLLYAAPVGLRAGAGEDSESEIRRVSAYLAQASGVDAVTVADGLPLDFRYRLARVSTRPDPNVAPTTTIAHVTRVGDHYLDTMRIALLRGRPFASEDGAGAPLVTVISKTLADRLFPGAEAIGQRLDFQTSVGQDQAPRTLTVVGVVADFPTSQMSTEREQLLLPLAQHPDVGRDAVPVNDDREGRPTLMLVARSAPGEPPMKLTAAVENAVQEHDPDFDRAGLVTGAGLRQKSVDDFLTQSAVGAVTGGIALLLSALGIYGVVGLMVTARTREIAIRVTLGASRGRVIRMVLFDVIKLVAPGVGVGLLIAVALVRHNGGILGVPLSDTEPLAYIAGAAIAIGTALLAGLAPARRAASVQPMVAMRAT